MNVPDYYELIDISTILNPADLKMSFKELVCKVFLLKTKQAPKMLVSVMLDLALMIEDNRRKALVVMNPLNPEPMAISLFMSTNRTLNETQRSERLKIIHTLKKAGWAIAPGQTDNYIELSVAKYSYAEV